VAGNLCKAPDAAEVQYGREATHSGHQGIYGFLYGQTTNTKSQVVHSRWATTRVVSHGMALSSLLRRERGCRKGVGLRGGIPRGGGRLLVQIDVKTLRREIRPSKRPIVLNMRVRLCHKTQCMLLDDSRYVERR
jgi:hypothetical protein